MGREGGRSGRLHSISYVYADPYAQKCGFVIFSCLDNEIERLDGIVIGRKISKSGCIVQGN